VSIFSGLGNNISILTADNAYAGGLIHTTDGFFTVPSSLSSTAESTGETTFVSLTDSLNLTDALDSTPFITVFIPTNDAFAAANASTASADTVSILSGHVVPNFAGYLPLLTNGSTIVTQAGTSLTVTIDGDNYFINDAQIVSSNLITDNGVAHVIDKVLTPSPTPSIVPFTGAGSSLINKGAVNALAIALSTTLLSMAYFL
jgi:hypothetical protein